MPHQTRNWRIDRSGILEECGQQEMITHFQSIPVHSETLPHFHGCMLLNTANLSFSTRVKLVF